MTPPHGLSVLSMRMSNDRFWRIWSWPGREIGQLAPLATSVNSNLARLELLVIASAIAAGCHCKPSMQEIPITSADHHSVLIRLAPNPCCAPHNSNDLRANIWRILPFLAAEATCVPLAVPKHHRCKIIGKQPDKHASFRHPAGAAKDECLILSARVAALEMLQREGNLRLPMRRVKGCIQGLSGQYHDAWAVAPAETANSG